jgi:membrane protein
VGPARRWLFLWHDVRNFVRRVHEGAVESNVSFLASGLAFDALLAAVPLVLVALSLVGYVLSARAAAARLDPAAYLRQLLPDYGTGSAGNPFAPVLHLAESVVRQRGRLTLVGLPLFVWFAAGLFGSLRTALCEIFDTRETRSWLRGKILDVGLVVATGVLVTANLALSEGLLQLEGRHGFVAFFGAQLLAFAFLVALFAMIFKYAPAHRVRWDTALVAALVCAVGFDVARAGLAVYFRHLMRPDRLVSDATLGALFLFVAWVYYLTFVFLIGAQIAQVYELRRRQAAQRTVLFD